jgi:glycosyltransferase involved in cell wall biosynthesis/O-antigen/teichoic acid export membrane protein
MKNVLHAIDTTGPGGAETVFMTLARRLDPSRFRSHVAVAGTGWLHDELRGQGFEPFIVGGQKGFDIAYLRRLIRIIRQQRIDIVQSHLFGSNLYCSLAGAITRVPVVCTFHGGVDVGHRGVLQSLKLEIINRCAKRIVSVSRNLEENLRSLGHLTASKSMVIYNGVDTNLFKPVRDDSIRRQLGLDASDIVVGAVGNIRPAKSYETLLDAAAELKKASSRYKFLIAGQGKGELYERILARRSELKLEGTVFFLGFQADVPRLLNNFDVFVLSSRTEGFSIATIEAMACALPVIATRCGGPQEIIQHEHDGLLVDVDDGKQLAAAIRRVGEHAQFRHTSIYALGNVIRYMASFVMLPIYTRYLSTADYGVLELLGTAIDLAAIVLGLRIGEAVFRYYAEKDTTEHKNSVIMTSLVLVASMFGVGVALLIAISEPLAGLIFGSGEFTHYFRLFAVVLLLQSLTDVPLMLVRAQQRPWLFVGFSTLRLVLQVGFNIYFVVLQDLRVEGVIYGALASYGIFAALMLFYTINVTGWVRPDIVLGRKMLVFSLPLMLSGIGAYYLTFGDRYFLRVYADFAEIGIYALAYKFGFLLGYLTWTPFSNIWDAQKYHIQKRADGRLIFQRTFLLISFVMIFVSLGLSLFIGDALKVISAPEFWPASRLVPVILLAYVVQAWTFYCSLGIYVRGNTIQVAYSTAAASVAITIGYFALVPSFGGMGAAIATVVAFLVRMIWLDVAARKQYDMELPWGTAVAILGVATMVYLLGTLWVPDHWFGSLAWKGMLCVAFVGLFLVVPIFTEAQRRALWASIRNPRKIGEILG